MKLLFIVLSLSILPLNAFAAQTKASYSARLCNKAIAKIVESKKQKSGDKRATPIRNAGQVE